MHCSGSGGPNLGITYFKSSPASIALVQNWLSRADSDKWDQNEFKVALEEGMSDFPNLQVQVSPIWAFPMAHFQQALMTKISELKS